VSSVDDKRHAYSFLVPCLTGDVAHAKVLQILIDSGVISYEDLGITPEDMVTFRALSRIADPKERALKAFQGCRDGNVLANFGVIQHLLYTRKIRLTDLRIGDDSILKVGSDLIHFNQKHAKCLSLLLLQEEPTQD
jgi:hypothetical protein